VSSFKYSFRRLSAAIIGAYALTVVLWESFAPPWAGDHIGLSGASILAYAVSGAIWLAIAHGVIFVALLMEGRLGPIVTKMVIAMVVCFPALWCAAAVLRR
jgi:hypothetical protein